MNRDPRYDILFEPLRIGPHLAKNRFFQVAHCNGMGSSYPKSMAAMREVKAEGGWAVVTTEETEIHPTSDMSPIIEGRFWDERDIPAFARMTEGIHKHGALAAIELSHSGHRDACLYSREIPLSVTEQPVVAGNYPQQARRMDLADIRAFRRWHRAAALRAREAGFDIITVYCRAAASLPGMFLAKSLNTRGDEYGGSLENRVRLLREVLEDTHDAVGDRCAVSLRFTIDEADFGAGPPSGNEARDVIAMLAELPDLWDVNVREWRRDSRPSRFGEEGAQEELVSFVKQMTSKPVVGVGRFTSPDTMLSQVRRGVIDFIGAARPSIADPFLPKKIEEGRLDEIRECIGCNICVSADSTIVPLRCTQNPTTGEEWRKGWHPEFIPPKASDDTVLIVGGGPAGLECAHALAKRGYGVTLADRASALGGRLNRETKLPGLATWLRVRDHRLQALQTLAQVALYSESELDAEGVLEFGCPRVVLATGARWRRDGQGRFHAGAIPRSGALPVLTPDDIFAGQRPPSGQVVLFDDDHYYLGGAIAEQLRREGYAVTLVTPAAEVSAWSAATLEQPWIEERLSEIGVELLEMHAVSEIGDDGIRIVHARSGVARDIACSGLVLVTMRQPEEALYLELAAREADWAAAGVKSVTRIGDCLAPATIAAAVYAGHRYARELDAEVPAPVAFKRQLPA